MVLNEEILFSLGADTLDYKINEEIFSEGQPPHYYYQIRKGVVKLTKDRENGTESIFSIFFEGQCFAETFLFTDKKYPFNAVAMEDCEILRVSGEKIVDFLKLQPESLLNLYTFNAERVYYRYLMLNCLAINDSMLRVKELFKTLKEYSLKNGFFSYQIPFTRQQLSSITSLRPETVIRVVKKMEKDNIVQIRNGKIFF
ncbi:Crp/Fnr family transcriptional regulator [Chryseobacterium sp. NRRL B-14859]|uniref:Crp/Fnr family transcriptional regulator n=1 Tax=unclassified Chryseobacterium TaxID=2593645 RepID=UPI000F44F085|nr:Crp/Fnr family transcriptional regulator [Chryseobacterium sp. G0240]ROI06897.1 Crp/Fnr family transcriptional regulator [Chryseobacterium sp. G0240]